MYYVYRFFVAKGLMHRPANVVREFVRLPFIFDRVSFVMQMRQLARVKEIAAEKPADDLGKTEHFKKVFDHNATTTSTKQVLTNRLSERAYAVIALPVRELRDEKLLSIGSRTVHELLIAWTQGFSWKNITGVDLYSTHQKILPMNMENLSIEDEQYDCVVMANVLSYASDTKQALSEALRVLKPGGRFVFNGTYDPQATDLWPESYHSGKDLHKMLHDLGAEIYFWHSRDIANSLGNVETDHLIGCVKPPKGATKADPFYL